ncbi:hypothetical protein [Nonomuraea sp. NPDC050310]|uniref:hypothetical protein n=1 Tax=Nonomuraea sp. NPDC050310 TaxID=3154935 RepID=UPI0033E23F33
MTSNEVTWTAPFMISLTLPWLRPTATPHAGLADACELPDKPEDVADIAFCQG